MAEDHLVNTRLSSSNDDPEEELIGKYEIFHNYDWKSDNFFKNYLSQLLSKNLSSTSLRSDDSKEDLLILKAKIWFYNKKYKDSNINLQQYISLLNSKKLSDTFIPEFEQESPYYDIPEVISFEDEGDENEETNSRLSYDQLVQLISSGEEIPGIKKIKPIVNIGQESQSVLKQRKKPWE